MIKSGSAAEIFINAPRSVFLYGNFGVGKTTFATSAPKPYWLDTEDSAVVLLNNEATANLPVTCLENWKEVESVMRTPTKLGPVHLTQFNEAQTIVLDTMTSLQDNELMEQQIKLDANPNRAGELSQYEWTINKNRMRRVIYYAKKLHKNLIIIAHIVEEKDQQTQTIKRVRPGVTPSVLSIIAQQVDGVYYMQSVTDSKGDTTRKLLTAPAGKFVGKNRMAELPTWITNPSWADIQIGIDKQRILAQKVIDNGN